MIPAGARLLPCTGRSTDIPSRNEGADLIGTHRIPDFIAPAPGDLAQVTVAGRAVAVTVDGGRAYAFDDVCTHLQCSLSGGEVEYGAVVCPCHFATFDITTGAVRSGPALTDLRSYPATLIGGVLHVEVPE